MKNYFSSIFRIMSVFLYIIAFSLILSACSLDLPAPPVLLKTVEMPTFSPAANTFASDQSVIISNTTAGSEIYYTTDGSLPTKSSTLFTVPISVAGNGKTMIIRSIAVKNGMKDSAVVEATYIINYNAVSAPTFNPVSGKVVSGSTISMSTLTSGAGIYYTTDGSIPVYPGNGTAGSTVSVDSAMTVKAIAYKAGMADSGVSSADYTLKHWITAGSAGTVMYSDDGGLSWTSGNSGTTSFFNDTAYGGIGWLGAVRFVAVGEAGLIRYSYDGGINLYTGTSGTTDELRGVVHTLYDGSGKFAAVGDSGTVIVSNNGKDWYSRSTETVADLYSVTSDSTGRFVAVGAVGTVLYSTNGGSNWISGVSGTKANLRSVTSGSGNRLVAVGNSGVGVAIIYSGDGGATWTPVTPAPTNSLYGVSSDSTGRFITVGANGTILYSSDGGENWTSGTSGTTASLVDVSYDDNGRFIATGVNGTIIYSDNGGVTWTSVDSGTTNTLYSVIFEN